MKTMNTIFGLDAIRGFLGGLIGFAAGTGITMLVRLAVGLPAWSPDRTWSSALLSESLFTWPF